MQEESSKISVKVRRSGSIKEVFIDDLVVGDIVILASGDKVPADITLIEGKLSVDESSLNGEAKESYKEEVRDINNILIIGSPNVSINKLKKVLLFFPNIPLLPYFFLASITSLLDSPLLFIISILPMLNSTNHSL